ncbi:MAG: DNA mismatch repair protein MutS, partial [Maribacter sp.]
MRIEKNHSLLEKVKKQLFAFSMLRLFVFCLAAVSIYFAYGNTKLVIGIIMITIVLFLLLVSKYTGLQYKRDRLNAIIDINKTELEVLNRNFHHLPNGDSFKDPQHYFSQDIDLFGKGSFYQYANRTVLREGGETLSEILTENSIHNIEGKQKAISELSKLPEWRQNFQAIASLSRSETDAKIIVKWLKSYSTFVPSIMRYLPLIFSALSIGVATLYFLNVIAESFFLYWILFGLLITLIFAKKMTKLGLDLSKTQATFEQYNKLLLLIEETDFSSDLLNQKKDRILSNGERTAVVLKEFSKLLSSLEQNNNFIFLIFGNGLFLRGLATCFKIENWIKSHGSAVENWFQIIAFFDAYNSLGNFAFNHPDYVFPIILEKEGVLKAKQAGHPLLDPEKSVLNDFEINTEEFFIITGANMAGKSTFLRTVSLQIVMANIGLPVCAKSVSYAPMKLITSMRTTDSLTDDESY